MTTQPWAAPAELYEGANKYEILGVPSGATAAQLKLAFRRLALLHHPDRRPEAERAQAERTFKRIAAAYETLSDPAERRRYDRALDGGYAYHDRKAATTASLQSILADIQGFEHIFAEGALAQHDTRLDELVQSQLAAALSERIVAVWTMPEAPPGLSHRGTYQSGAVVLTTLRILLPFAYSWVEQHGNVQHHYRGCQMQSIFMPSLRRIMVLAEGQLYQQLWVELESPEGRVRFRPGHGHLGKLLLLAKLWGVPIASQERHDARAELRRALRQPTKVAAVVGGLALGCVLVAGVFSGDFLGTLRAAAAYVHRSNIWHAMLALWATSMAWQAARWMLACREIDLVTAMRMEQKRRTGARAPRVATGIEPA